MRRGPAEIFKFDPEVIGNRMKSSFQCLIEVFSNDQQFLKKLKAKPKVGKILLGYYFQTLRDGKGYPLCPLRGVSVKFEKNSE